MDITQKIEALGFAKLIGNAASGTPEWHALRAGIGGSDIGAILGKSQFKSPYTLWAEKSQLIDQPETSMPMKLGTYLEPAIRQLFADENKDFLTVHETGTWQSTDENWAKANPDGIIEWANGELGVLEIKHSATYTDIIPAAWSLQVEWYLHILGLKRGIVCAVIGGRYTEFSVSTGDSLDDVALSRVRAFYDLIIKGEEPEFDGSNSTLETVREMLPGIIDDDIDLGSLWEELCAAKLIYEKAEENLTLRKTITLAYMQGIKNGYYKGEKVVSLSSRNGGKPFITFK